MKAHTRGGTIRRSVALPETLASEVMSVAPAGSEKSFNRVVLLALSEFVANRKKQAFAGDMEQMASDPAIRAECNVINRDFSEAETDGLSDD
jgi:hypothetical protein